VASIGGKGNEVY